MAKKYKDIAEVKPQEKIAEMDFDSWFAARENSIPGHHRKEIIKADFLGRGLSLCETEKDFDEALVKYGIKLA